MPASHGQARKRSYDRVGHQPGLIGEEHGEQRALGQREPDVRAERAQMAACSDPGPSRNDPGEDREQRGQRERGQDEAGPDGRSLQGQRPAGHQGGDCRRRGQRAAQVVQHLPATDRRQRARAPTVGGSVAAAEDPRQELPVAARPPVLASGGHVVARRKLLDHLDVGDEAGARERPLEEVVAEQRTFGHAPLERGFEGIDVVDALAGVGAFAEKVLVHVGDGGGVGIDTPGGGEDALEERSSRPIGSEGVTRGCSTPYPPITRRVATSNRGRLSGCAILPTSRRAVSRGIRVSASSVIT